MNIRQRVNQASAGPARAALRPVYTDFTPTHDWRADEEGSAVLVLSVPGFTRQQIKVTAEPSGNIRVRGLRQIGGRNWSRFNSEFRVPEDCSMAGIRAKYDHGNLYITIPRKTPLQSKISKEEPRVTPAQPLSPSLPSKPPLPQPSSPLKQSEPKPPSPPLAPPVPQPEYIQPQPPQIPSELKQEESQPEPLLHIQPPPQRGPNAPSAESDKSPLRSHDEPWYYSENKEEELKEWENPESLAERILKGGAEKRKEPTSTAGAAEKPEHMMKEHLDEKARETETVIGTRVSSDLKLEDYMQIAKSKLAEERQTLVNIVVAVLVIAGLGVYICSNIGRRINN